MAETALRYVLGTPAVSTVIPGMRSGVGRFLALHGHGRCRFG
jgi:hypothetical protein